MSLKLMRPKDESGLYIPDPSYRMPIPGIARARRIQRWWKLKREVRVRWAALGWWLRIRSEVVEEAVIAIIIVAVIVLAWLR